MRGYRYHETASRLFMVSKVHKSLICIDFYAIRASVQIMVFELTQDERHVDRYQAAQPQAEGQALQGE